MFFYSWMVPDSKIQWTQNYLWQDIVSFGGISNISSFISSFQSVGFSCSTEFYEYSLTLKTLFNGLSFGVVLGTGIWEYSKGHSFRPSIVQTLRDLPSALTSSTLHDFGNTSKLVLRSVLATYGLSKTFHCMGAFSRHAKTQAGLV